MGPGRALQLRHNALGAGGAGSRSRLQPGTRLLLRLPDTKGSAKGRGKQSPDSWRSCSHGERSGISKIPAQCRTPVHSAPGQLLSAAGPLLSTEASQTRYRPSGFVVQGRVPKRSRCPYGRGKGGEEGVGLWEAAT